MRATESLIKCQDCDKQMVATDREGFISTVTCKVYRENRKINYGHRVVYKLDLRVPA